MTNPGQLPIFADGKEPDALRTIGEVAAALGIRQHVLRYWEAQFPMLQPLKRSGWRRYYRRADIELVGAIDRLVNREGYTLKGARQAIEQGSPSAAASPVAKAETVAIAPAAVAPASGDLLPRLTAIRDRLAAALAA